MTTTDIHRVLREFISPRETADRLGVSVRTLTNWANTGNGPVRYRFSPSCSRYRLAEVVAWIEAQRGR